MYWHIETDAVSLVAACLLLLYQTRLYPEARDKMRARNFCACLWVCVGVTCIDIAASVVMEAPTNRFVYHALMTLYFVSIVQVILSWFYFSISILYADSPRRGGRVGRIAAVPYALYALIALSNPWTGLIYTLGEGMEYRRGPLFFLMVFIFAGYTLSLMALTLLRRKHISKRYSGHVLLTIPILLAISIFFQLTNGGWLVILPGYTVCLLMAFLFLQSREISETNVLMRHLSMEASMDKLTGVLNRVGAEARIRQALISGHDDYCLVVIVDVDNLKYVNDTMGHEGGDRALKAVSGILRDHFRTSDIVARFGGDEFIACIFGRLTEELIRRWMRELTEKLTNVSIGDSQTVSASIGAAWGTADKPTVDALFHRADAALYSVKRNGKHDYALYAEQHEQGMF